MRQSYPLYRLRLRHVWIGIALIILTGVTTEARTSPAQSIRLTVTGPRVAAKSIIYEIEHRFGTFTVRRTEDLGFGFAERSDLSLLPAKRWHERWQALVEHIKPGWHSTKPAIGRMTYTFTMSGGPYKEIRLVDPSVQTDQAPWHLISDFIRFVERTVIVPPDWDRRLLRSEAGHLRVESRPPANIILNDVNLQRRTPVSSMVLTTGTHHIVLVHPKTQEKWSYMVQIRVGSTTFLNVDLE